MICIHFCLYDAVKRRLECLCKHTNTRRQISDYKSFPKRLQHFTCAVSSPPPPDLAHSTRRCWRYKIFSLFARNLEEYNALKNRIYAKMALDFLNKKHGTKFKLVKSLRSSILPVSYGVYKFHWNFKAKHENTDSSESDDDSHKKYLFFGDIIKSTLSTEGEFHILENTEDLDDHCSICRNGVLHPPHYRNSGHSS
ncbi:uncharacterized protein LOC130814626 isoform X2 [Amaranthus tricolor]|uniref:uncharacterized protein LOC130814626 isoform X2 n=1 Tax=Amaranthus tricolor TaxID=29722 RepID=UPI00258A4812|nr:uncharacterized protein LOC130814626 isoform X2 [Amaranthus tricolor]XP_057536733.1 uncharacterized protein LOC130814626 isoform X2 [Amaranthus tricolor]XP_057536734.1 uncharacterized protein LOC130814626 isoform X2 [Amaranthus tricolor]